MRASMIPSRRVPIKKVDKGHVLCIGCGADLTSGFNYTGSMITGLKFNTIQGIERSPIKLTGSITGPDNHTYPIMVGGDLIQTERRIGYFARKKGPLCDSCSSLCAKTITDKGGNKHQIVTVDPRPGFIGRTLQDGLSEPKKKLVLLNTTITR